MYLKETFSILISQADVRKLGGWANRSRMFVAALYMNSEVYILDHSKRILFLVEKFKLGEEIELREIKRFDSFMEIVVWPSNLTNNRSCQAIIFRQLSDFRDFSLIERENIFVDIDDLESDTIDYRNPIIKYIKPLIITVKKLQLIYKEQRQISKARHIFRIRSDRKSDSKHSSTFDFPASSMVYTNIYIKSDSNSKSVLFVSNADNQITRNAISFFIENCLGYCSQNIPGFKFVIVSQATTRKAKIFFEGLKHLTNVDVNVNVLDIKPFYNNCALFINPLQDARGVSIKTIEGFLMGRTGVVSNAGMRGLPRFFDNDYCFIKDKGFEVSNSVIELINNVGLRWKMEKNTYNQAKKLHSPETLVNNLSSYIQSKQSRSN